MPRSNIATEEKIAYSIADEAGKANKTLYAFVNESLEADLKVYKDGGTPSDIYPSWRFVQMLKDVDAIPVPGDLLEKLIRRSYENPSEREWLLKTWFDEGKRLGTYLQLGSPKIAELTAEVRALQDMLPVKRIELKSDEKNESGLIVRAVGIGLSAESTRCAEQFLRGIISSYSLNVTGSKV
ncbi:MAG: hypothetical protein JRN52_05885, partial [Nitrososphaerota archaeon]|nr:hypothetical protein [Nitrososphaerota archaeon]